MAAEPNFRGIVAAFLDIRGKARGQASQSGSSLGLRQDFAPALEVFQVGDQRISRVLVPGIQRQDDARIPGRLFETFQHPPRVRAQG
ncbi:MAG: hypothetical protein Q8T11_11305 [Elusimicrobiota bacterium]|nr:hypothetical protein [Elusimicrobiota bacterium]